MGLLDLGNAISRTGFRSHVLHSLEGKGTTIMPREVPSRRKPTYLFAGGGGGCSKNTHWVCSYC